MLREILSIAREIANGGELSQNAQEAVKSGGTAFLSDGETYHTSVISDGVRIGLGGDTDADGQPLNIYLHVIDDRSPGRRGQLLKIYIGSDADAAALLAYARACYAYARTIQDSTETHTRTRARTERP